MALKSVHNMDTQDAAKLIKAITDTVNAVPGTASASKALVLDANKDFAGVRNGAFTGTVTPAGGVVAAGGFTASPRNIHTGGNPPAATTDFSDYTVVNTEVLIGEVFVPANCTVTGVALFNGSAVAGNVKVGLCDSAGNVLATSVSTAQAGTDAYQRINFTAPLAVKGPATYYIVAMGDTNGGTSKINAHTVGNFGAAKQTAQVFATGFTAITPPTTFTTALGVVASLF